MVKGGILQEIGIRADQKARGRQEIQEKCWKLSQEGGYFFVVPRQGN